MRNPFRVFANQNLGTQYDYTTFTDQILPFSTTGSFPILPEVNLATGNTILKSTIKIQESIGDWEFGYVFNSQNTERLSLNLPRVVDATDNTVTMTESDGSTIVYNWSEEVGAYLAPAGSASRKIISIVSDPSPTYYQTDPATGLRTIYNAQGNIQSITSRDGAAIEYQYDKADDLVAIVSDSGQYTISNANNTTTISFTKNGEKESQLLATWDLNYTTTLTLHGENGAADYKIQYALSKNNELCVSQDDGTQITMSFSAPTSTQPAQITSLQQGTCGGAYTFGYNQGNTTITDARGFVTTASLNQNGNIENLTQQIGDDASDTSTITTAYEYHSNNDIKQMTTPNGGVTKYTFNNVGLVSEKISPNGQTIQYDYDGSLFKKIIKRTLIKNGEEQKWATQRYVYGDGQLENGAIVRLLRFIVSPEGAVTEFRYDEKNHLTSKRIYLGAIYNVDDLSHQTPIYHDDMIKWIGKQDAQSITLETYERNARGQITQKKVYSKIDENGCGIETADASDQKNESITIWGGCKEQKKKVDEDASSNPVFATQANTFDAVRRVTSQTNALNETQTTTYDDANQQSVLLYPNGRTETLAHNDAGKIVSKTIAVPNTQTTRVENNCFDSAGNCVAITHCDGNTTYQLFDGKNRLRFSISPCGIVTENRYDDVNRYTSKVQYKNEIDISTLSTMNLPTFTWIASQLKKSEKNDAVTYQIKDSSNRIQFEIDARGAVTEYRYDLAGNQTITIAYSAQLSSSEIADIKNGSFSRTPGSTDSIHVTFYNKDRHVIAKQDPKGYVTLFIKNPAGFDKVEYHFATEKDMMLDNKLELPVFTDDDFALYFYTDAKGNAKMTVDAINGDFYVKTQSFFPSGKIKKETKYANPTQVTPTPGSDPESLLPEQSSEDQVTSLECDLLERVTCEHLPHQRMRYHGYDNMNHEIITAEGDDQTQLPPGSNITTEVTAKKFDSWGQLVAEVTPLLFGKIMQIQNNEKLTDEEKQSKIDGVWDFQSLRYAYDEKTGLNVAKIDIVPDGADVLHPAVTLFYFDADRRAVLTIDPEGQACKMTLDSVTGKPIETKKYAKRVDMSGLVGGFYNKEIAALLKSSSRDITETREYDGCGAETEFVDGDGYKTKTQFNMFGDWCEKQLPIHTQEPTLVKKRIYDLRHQLLTETETADGNTITTVNKEYKNMHGLCTSTTDANGEKTALNYEPRGVLKSTVDPLNRETKLSHDAFSRETKRVLPTGTVVKTDYIQASRQTITTTLDSDETQLSQTKETVDAFSNTILKQDENGNTTQLYYNLQNKCTVVIDAEDNQHRKDYDLRGLLIHEHYRNSNTKLFKTVKKLKYNLSRQVISETLDAGSAGLQLERKYAWNALSQRYKETTPSGYHRRYRYNKRGMNTRLEKILDGKTSVISEKNYNAKNVTGFSTSTTSANEKSQEQIQHDGFGRVKCSVTDPNKLKITRQTVLDNASRIIAKIDGNGQTSFYIRDAVGNIRFVVNPKGGVIEHRYNAANKPYFTIQYKTPVALSEVTEGMKTADFEKLLTETNYDRHTHYFYDALNNERFKVNRAGAVTEKRYDKKSQEIADIQYNTRLTSVSGLTTKQLEAECKKIRDTSNDRATYRVLDGLGQERFLIYADGTVIERKFYSVLHQQNVEIRYAIKVADPEKLAAMSADDIGKTLTTSADDRYQYWMVDHLNRLQFSVASNGAVTRYDYDGDTKNKTRIVEFASAATLPSSANQSNYLNLQASLAALSPNSQVDNIELREYDTAEREIKRTNGLGNTESFGYDGASRRSSHTTLSGNKWRYEFDGANRLWREISPETITHSSSITVTNGVPSISIESNKGSVKKETQYDNNSNITSITSGVGLPDEDVINFAYDELNLRTTDQWNNVPVDNPNLDTSLTVRPENICAAVKKETVFGVFTEKLITWDEANNPTFYAYNSEGELQYKVNAKGYVIEYCRNAFNGLEKAISYHTQLPIDLTKYYDADIATNTLLTPDIISKNLVKNASRDRTIYKKYDQRARIIQEQKDSVLCYIPSADPKTAPTVAMQTPTTITTYNTFGEVIATLETVDQTNGVTNQTLIWRDASGNKIATVDQNGKVIIREFNTANKETKEHIYANSIASDNMPTTQTTFAQLQAMLTANSDRDVITETTYDVIGNMLSRMKVNVVAQKIQGQGFVDLPAASVGEKYTHTKTNKIKTITYPDNQVKILYYNERDDLIAEAGVVRTKPDGTQIRPITYYHVAASGKRVGVYTPESGCAIDLDPTSDTLPLPISVSDKDQYLRFAFDPRNNLLAKQDAENNLQQLTHTITGKVARHFKPTTSADPDATNQRVTDIDEKRRMYNELDQVLEIGIYRNNKLHSQEILYYDGHDLIGKGNGDGNRYEKYEHDQAGRKWMSYNSDGGVELLGCDAAGRQTVSILSNTLAIDLSTTTYADLSTIMGNRDQIANYCFTETLRDGTGRATGVVEPGYPDPNDPTKIIRPLFQIGWSNTNKKNKFILPGGQTTTYAHNKLGKLKTQTDPAIATLDESGNTSTIAAVTQFGYNASAGKIGMLNANNCAELFVKDEANQDVQHILGDGTVNSTNSIDTFGNVTKRTSASGNEWVREFNRKNKLISITMPSGDQTVYELNENDFMIQMTPPTNSATGPTLYAQGVYGDVRARFLPMGEKHIFAHDPHHGELLHEAIDAQGNIQYTTKSERDYWSRITSQTDGSGSTYQQTYYNNGLLYQRLGVNVVNHGLMPVFNAGAGTFSQSTQPMQLQNLTYSYLTHLRLQSIVDGNAAFPQTLAKLYDISRNVTSLTETNQGVLIRNTAITYNDRRMPTCHTDINFCAYPYYDPCGNRRRLTVVANGLSHDAWWTDDKAGRVIINDGVKNGSDPIQSVASGSGRSNNFGYYSPSQGNTFSYGFGLRVTQSLLTNRSMARQTDQFSAVFSYNNNEMISGITVQNANMPATPISDVMDVQVEPLPSEYYPDVQWSPGSQSVTLFWTTMSGQTNGNTVVAVMGQNSVMTGSINISTGSEQSSSTINNIVNGINYNLFFMIYLNGKVYQWHRPLNNNGHRLYYPENIIYTPDGLLRSAYINLGSYIPFVLAQNNYNLNGYATRTITQKRKSQSDVSYAGFTVDGLATGITNKQRVYSSRSQSYTDITDDLSYGFYQFFGSVVSSITGTRTDPYGTTSINCPYYYDSNVKFASAANVNNPFKPSDTRPHTLFVTRSLMGPVISESAVFFDSNGSAKEITTANYYQDTAGEEIAEYTSIENTKKQSESVVEIVGNPVQSFKLQNLYGQPFVVIQKGDDWKTLSYRIFGDPNYASALRMFSNVLLIPGQVINIPQVISSYENSKDYAPYEKLINTLYNSIYPALKTPEPPPPPVHHESFLDEFIGIVVSIVAMIVLPAFATSLFTCLGPLLSTVMGYAVAGAVADASAQGVAVAFDDQHGFSVTEMLNNALAAGVTGGLGKVLNVSSLFSGGSCIDMIKDFTATLEINLTAQAIELAAGTRKKIDITYAIEQAAAAVISSKIDKEVSAHTSHSILINGADELANSATGVAFGSPVDLTSLAGNMVGDEVGEAADYYGKQIKLHASNDPGDSHKKPTPASYANSIQSTQTAPTFVSQDTSANDPLYHLYRNQNDYTSEAFGSMDDADYASAHASHHSQVDHERLMGMQRGAVAKASLENRIEDKCMQFAANIAMLNLNAMHMFAHGITAQNLMNPFDSMEEAYSGHDPLNGRSVGLGQAYVDFGESMVAFGVTSVGGIADTIGAGVENLAANTARLLSDIPSVGRNVASMFGRGVSNPIADALDEPIAKHPLDGWTPEQVIQHVNQLGLKTPRDQLILWSGLGRNGIEISQKYAAENGGITLELTPGGKWLHQMKLFDVNSPFSENIATEIWGVASTSLARQASGQVRALVGQVRPGSIYMSREVIELRDNVNVAGLDEVSIQSKFPFLKY